MVEEAYGGQDHHRQRVHGEREPPATKTLIHLMITDSLPDDQSELRSDSYPAKNILSMRRIVQLRDGLLREEFEAMPRIAPVFSAGGTTRTNQTVSVRTDKDCICIFSDTTLLSFISLKEIANQ